MASYISCMVTEKEWETEKTASVLTFHCQVFFRTRKLRRWQAVFLVLADRVGVLIVSVRELCRGPTVHRLVALWKDAEEKTSHGQTLDFANLGSQFLPTCRFTNIWTLLYCSSPNLWGPEPCCFLSLSVENKGKISLCLPLSAKYEVDRAKINVAVIPTPKMILSDRREAMVTK